jgi:hypothetical protein
LGEEFGEDSQPDGCRRIWKYLLFLFPPKPHDKPRSGTQTSGSYFISVPKNSDDFEDSKILSTDVRRVPADPRMLPWLWEGTASIVVTRGSGVPGPSTEGIIWRELFQFRPEARGGECWREITQSRRGFKIRKHYQFSEWTREFRSQVSAGWVHAFQKLEQEARQRSHASESDRQERFKAAKGVVADRFKISVDELNDILEATD